MIVARKLHFSDLYVFFSSICEPVILASLQDCQNNFNKIVANIGPMLVTVRDLIVVSLKVFRLVDYNVHNF